MIRIIAIILSVCRFAGCQIASDETKPSESSQTSVPVSVQTEETTEYATEEIVPAVVVTMPGTVAASVPVTAETEGCEESEAEEETEHSVPVSQPAPKPNAEELAVLKQFAVDYLSADYASVEDNPLVWADIDRLAEINSVLADVWIRILSEWDKADADGFMDELPQDGSLCFVVLGYRLNQDGSMDPELISRLQTALTYANDYPAAHILVTGGNPVNGLSEAQEMAMWLTEGGVDPDRIFTEESSRTTIENVLYCYGILQKYPEIQKIAVITSGYHLQAAVQLFQEKCILAGEGITVSAAIPSPSGPIEGFSAATRAAWITELARRS